MYIIYVCNLYNHMLSPRAVSSHFVQTQTSTLLKSLARLRRKPHGWPRASEAVAGGAIQKLLGSDLQGGPPTTLSC